MEASLSLSDGVILLRPPVQDDAPACWECVQESLPELTPWMSWAHPDYRLEEARRWFELVQTEWQLGRQFHFAIIDAASGQFLGGCGLSHLNRTYGFANLGYWVRTGRRGQGIAPRAARLAARFGFERAGLIRAEIVAAVGNLASQRAAEKAGARREGILRNRMVVGRVIHDAVMFSLVPQDFALAAALP